MTVMPVITGDIPGHDNRTWQWHRLEEARTALAQLRETTIAPPKGVNPGDHRTMALELAEQAVAHLNHALTVEGPEDALLAARDVLAHAEAGLDTLRRAPIGQDPIHHPDLVVALERALQRLEDAQRAIEETEVGFG